MTSRIFRTPAVFGGPSSNWAQPWSKYASKQSGSKVHAARTAWRYSLRRSVFVPSHAYRFVWPKFDKVYVWLHCKDLALTLAALASAASFSALSRFFPSLAPFGPSPMLPHSRRARFFSWCNMRHRHAEYLWLAVKNLWCISRAPRIKQNKGASAPCFSFSRKKAVAAASVLYCARLVMNEDRSDAHLFARSEASWSFKIPLYLEPWPFFCGAVLSRRGHTCLA